MINMVVDYKLDFLLHIAEVCGGLLKRYWRGGESGQQRNEALEYLLKYHIEWAEDPLAKIECITGDAVTELIGEEPKEESQEYPTLSKYVHICVFPLGATMLPFPPLSPSATMPCYYRCMLTALISQLKKIPPPNKKNIPTPEVSAAYPHSQAPPNFIV